MLPFARPALAWVPPADFLVGKMADRRKGVKTLRTRGIRTYSGRSFDGGKQDVTETFEANVTDASYRLERKTPRGIYLEVSDGKRRVSVNDGTVGPVEADARPLERLLFTGAGKDDLLAAMQAFGIRMDVASLTRLDGKIAWLVGAKENDQTVPALWIEKDRNLPLKLVDPRAKRTVSFEGWSEPGGAGVLPTRLTILKGNDVQETLKLEETRTNPKLPANLFKPDAPLVATPAPAASPAVTPKPTPKPKPKPR